MTKDQWLFSSVIPLSSGESSPRMPKRILILMSDTGGGHRASAEAIAEALAHLYGEKISVSIVDAWRRCAPWPLNQIPDAYSWLVSDGLWLWNALWRTDDQTLWPRVISGALTPVVRRSAVKLFRAEAPDMVVTVHPIVNHIPLRVLRNTLKTDVPYVTVVTDMITVHPAWFCSLADYWMVPTETARQRALRYGMPSGRVEVTGQPVGLEFAKGIGEKCYLRGKFGLDQNRPTVLVVGGGEGMGPVYQTARAIATEVPNAQLIVVSGRNAVLKKKLDKTSWEIPTQIYGFVTHMAELMGASDVLVTKAGPGTLSEAFIAKLPVIIFGFIPGQEEGNVRYVLEHQAGAYAPTPGEVTRIIQEWLQPDKDTLKRMAINAAELARPDAAVVIAQRLHQLLNEKRAGRPISRWPDARPTPSEFHPVA
jgi:1,2-diacylglycerol 3-beta-galactosyltransferase